MADKKLQFAVPNQQISQDEVIDFSRMTKKEIKAYDAAEGSYKRLLGDKPITLLWLLNHYSAKNVEAYKQQKILRKEGKVKKPVVSVTMEEKPSPKQEARNIPSYDWFEEAPPKASIELPDDESEMTVMIDHDIVPQYKVNAFLECIGYNQRVEISKVPFVIGRDMNNVDLCFEGNNTVGRIHAKIISKDGAFYICDMNSKNGVWVDHERIRPEIPKILKNGAKIILGDEELLFGISD